jgi:nucleotide-binding universal stress UspA family protein
MYKTILTYLPSRDAADEVSLAAARLAKQHGAFLIGAHNVIKVTVYGGIPQDVLAQHDAREARDAEAIKFIFEQNAGKLDIPHEWRNRPARDTDAYRDIVAQTHAVDLVVAPGKDFNDPLGHWYDLPERLVLESGRPVLLVPRRFDRESFGKRIAVAWNNSRESARAVFDALPFLRAAEEVSVLTLSDTLEGPLAVSGQALTDTLTRQEVKAVFAPIGATGKPDGEELLSHVADRNCDMLVMGFYGHSRLRQWVWGGVTRAMLKAQTVPVFTSH